MLGSSFFDNDPMFPGHRDHMRQMDEMFRDPFSSMMGGGRLALPEQSRRDQQRHQQQGQNMTMSHRAGLVDPFSHFDSMFSNMRSMVGDMHRAFEQPMTSTSDGHMFQQKSVMSYSSSGDGAPRYYQASSSSRQAPGGVKETRQSVRDSSTGLQKMAVGHHIRDRAHIIARSHNTRTGETNENQDYVNLEEEELSSFDREYQDKWRSGHRRGVDDRHHDSHRHTRPTHRRAALPDTKSHRSRSKPKPLAVEFRE